MSRWGDALTREVDRSAVDEAWDRVRARRDRSRWRAQTKILVPLLAVAAVVVLMFTRPSTKEPGSAPSGPLALADGAPLPLRWETDSSEVVAFDDGSRVELARVTTLTTGAGDARSVALAMPKGSATFDVRPGGPRAWTIDAGDVRVKVLGTRFSVHHDGDVVDVRVERGKVQVEGARVPGGARILTAGEAFHLGAAPAPVVPAPTEAEPKRETEASSAQAPAPTVAPRVPVTPTPIPTATAMPTSTSAAPLAAAKAPSPRDAMRLADGARREGRLRDAVAILEGVVDRREPDAALAAFTLAKIHAEELADPSAAAVWFERSIERGLPVGLEEEAYARVVEQHAKRHRPDEVARWAKRYEARFPGGRHLERVRGWARD